ncbi:RNA-directed DNA polymerase from mobile element jockey [Eumeta japonica]|uniref:RNA-directed DNA polymerase from mobile element jockey n=1 Tax=Eumeta variegata TaxID=151549 RepID=A0A4C1X4H8_EUMVA|nr:RNA-directed DNA polymerase from mobile element jockey [Eumeta japonica]
MSASGCLQIKSVGRYKPKNISLISFNANGVVSSIDKLDKCAREYKADIIMVQETHLKPRLSNACKISNFVQLRTDRQGAPKGGTALYYNRSLYCCLIDTPPLVNIEATACRLSMTGHGILISVLVYLPPKKELLQSDLEALFALGDAVILFGNFNSKSTNWNCNFTNRHSREMEALAEDIHFNVVPPLSPTHYHSNDNYRPDILDIALMKGVALKLSCIETLQYLNSDHGPVLMSFYRRHDYAIGALTSHITTVVENSTRVVTAKSDRKELPSGVNELKREKNAVLRRVSKYFTCENRSHARALQREAKARMKEVRNENWSDLMLQISPSHRAYWGLAKTLKTEGAVPTPF